MTKRALLGLYTIASLLALLGLFAILSDFTTKLRGYRIGIRFPSAAGLHAGALVYESGVSVGSVDDVTVLPDYTSEVILSLDSKASVPANAQFLILQPLTGDSTLRITPRERFGGHSAAPLPRRILPVNEQPMGDATMSLAEFLASSQNQFAKLDTILGEFQTHGPAIFSSLERTLTNANTLMVTANQSISQLGTDAHESMSGFRSESTELTAQLSQSLAMASADVLAATARLNESSRRGQPHLDHVFVELDSASKSLAASVESLHAIASDPAIHENVVRSTRSLAETSATFAALLTDLRQVTGSETTQAQLRDAVAHIDAATQKADSFMSKFGRSHVPGVDGPLTTATPVPTVEEPQPATSPAAVRKSSDAVSPTLPGKRLIGINIREGELSPLHYTANGTPLAAPLLTQDRGPQTDVALTLFPDASTRYIIGGNDIGGTSTVTLAQQNVKGAFMYGGGILYSRLGVMGGVKAGPVGLETNIYDPRRGSVDVYGELFPDATTTLFVGERDATRDTRRNEFGVDFHF